MLAKEITVKRYVVRLSGEERERLETLLRKGKSPAQRLLKARILLKADVSKAGEGWSDSRIIKALGTSVSMIYRVRKQLVEEGFEAVLSRTLSRGIARGPSTAAPQQTASLFDHFVGGGEERRRHGQAQHSRGLMIDH